MENAEQLQCFEVFEIKPQIVAKGKKTTELVRSYLIRANVQDYAADFAFACAFLRSFGNTSRP
jgi:hypothetical protein